MPALSPKLNGGVQKARTKTHLPFIKSYYDPHPSKPITFVCRFCGVTYSGGHSFRMLAHLLPPNHPYGKKKPCQKVDQQTRNDVVENCRVYLQAREAKQNPNLDGHFSPAFETPSTSSDFSTLISDSFLGKDKEIEEVVEEPVVEKMVVEEKMKRMPKVEKSCNNNTDPNALQTMLNMFLNKCSDGAMDKGKNLLLLGIASGEIPLTTLDSEYFKAFLQTLFKDSPLPSKSELLSSEFIESEYLSKFDDIKSLIDQETHLHLSLDNWIDKNGTEVYGILVHTTAPYLYRVVAAEDDLENIVIEEIKSVIQELGEDRVVSFVNENKAINNEKIVRSYPWVLSPPVLLFDSLEMEGISQNLQSCFQVPSELVQADAIVQLLDPTNITVNTGMHEDVFDFISEKFADHPKIDIPHTLKHLRYWITKTDIYENHNNKQHYDAWRPRTFQGKFNVKSWWKKYYETSPLCELYFMLADIPSKSVTEERNFDIESYVANTMEERVTTNMKIFLKYNHMLTFHRQTARKPI